ncbi:hypothetical protein PS712_03144 [Pseudomonas fluorescens]|uniref:AAA+ ATPase domain-containing protein n=1 Tax=Pseudomonas fluorescens TaxID=294 RepID=A0A5E7CRY8_PSEFL|nr:ATP-binding protein [Pseudomonas fluorescens]VVO07001.1 hypothetical protein PS712_03144 [Pseudomonas fluorescens]
MNTETKNTLLQSFSETTVYFPKFAKAYSMVQNAIEMTFNSQSANSAIICGRSGTGKTTLCMHLFTHYKRMYDEELPSGVFKRTTTVYFEIPEPVTIKQMAEDMLIALGVTNAKGSVAHLTSMLITQLKTMGVKVVFLDEIQRLCLPSADKVRVPALGWIVSFCNRLKIPVILAGTQECRGITAYLQAFATRYTYMVVLNYFTYEPRPDSDYHRTLKKLDEIVQELRPSPNSIHFYDADIAAGLFVATSGHLKYLRTIIYRALDRCWTRDDENGLTREDFLYACDQLDEEFSLHTANPFLLNLSQCNELIQRQVLRLAELWVKE